MKKFLLISLLLFSVILTGCSSNNKQQAKGFEQPNNVILPETSFKIHIIQFWWLHSAIYDWVYWLISSLDEPRPMMDSSVNELEKWLLNIEYRWRKDYFNISCPNWFNIMNCEINEQKINIDQNSCSFYFPTEWNKNSDISFICNNWKFRNPF